MKITKQYLKQVIKEELNRFINEQPVPGTPTGSVEFDPNVITNIKNWLKNAANFDLQDDQALSGLVANKFPQAKNIFVRRGPNGGGIEIMNRDNNTMLARHNIPQFLGSTDGINFLEKLPPHVQQAVSARVK